MDTYKKINKKHYKLPNSFNDALLGRIFSAQIKITGGAKEGVARFFINILKNKVDFAGAFSSRDEVIITEMIGFLSKERLTSDDFQVFSKSFFIKCRHIEDLEKMGVDDGYEWSSAALAYFESYRLSATSDLVCTSGEKDAFSRRHMCLADKMLDIIESMEDSSLLMENVFDLSEDGLLMLAYSEKEIEDAAKNHFIDGIEIDFDEQVQCHAIYNHERILEILMQNEEMNYEEAMEWFDFNIEGSYLGTGMPYFVDAISLSSAKKEAQIKMNIEQ